MKKKRMIVTIAAILVGIVLGLIFYVNAMKLDLKYGLSLDVEDVSPYGATVYLRQDDKKKEESFTAGNSYQLQKLTVIGWKSMPMSQLMESVGKTEKTEEYYKKWNLEWKEVASGVYRVSKNVNVSGDARALSVPFIVWRWWNSLSVALMGAGIALAVILSVCLWKRVKRKKRFVIMMVFCVCAWGLLIGSASKLLEHLYYYEKTFATDDVLQIISMNDWQEEKLEVYSCSHFGSAEENTKKLKVEGEPIELSSHQRNAIRSSVSGKQVDVWRRLWYRYDAVVMYGNELKFMIDLENGVVFTVGEDYLDMGQEIVRPRKCVTLSDAELQTLKEALKGTGIDNVE